MEGVSAERALADFHLQMKAWGIALPPVKPLVLDFGLGDFRHTGLIEDRIANEAEAGYCGKYLFVFDGHCSLHHHRRKHETFFVVKGRFAVECDGRRLDLKEGEVLPVAPGTVHSFKGVGPALLLELSMPCEVDDNYFQDTRIPVWEFQREEAGMRLHVGAAVIDISPAHPVPLSGYPHARRISTGIHDPVLSSALYLENGSQALVLIALDLIALDPLDAHAMPGEQWPNDFPCRSNACLSIARTPTPLRSRIGCWCGRQTQPSRRQTRHICNG